MKAKNEIQFNYNVKKIKQEREFKKLLQQEKQFENRNTQFKNVYWIR